MQTEIASQTILTHLKSVPDDAAPVSMGQIKLWLVPQKAEHDSDYDINQKYFEMLLRQSLSDLLEKGYIASSVHDGAEDGDARAFSLTQKGEKYIEELAASYEGQ
jgi:hypothetical protein